MGVRSKAAEARMGIVSAGPVPACQAFPMRTDRLAGQEKFITYCGLSIFILTKTAKFFV